jgi:hypothetical protein
MQGYALLLAFNKHKDAKIYGSEHYMYTSVRVIISTFVDKSYITCLKDVMFNDGLTEELSVGGITRGGDR